MGGKWRLLLVLLLLAIPDVYSGPNKYGLGNGLVLYERQQVLSLADAGVKLYKDSGCTMELCPLVLENTTCPACFECAVSTRVHKGKLQPFMCYWTSGLGFVSFNTSERSYGIYINDRGDTAYIRKQQAHYYTWDMYMKHLARQGAYLEFSQGDDTTVLYDRIYPSGALPAPGKHRQIGVSFDRLHTLKFYPVKVEGRWMQLRAMTAKKTAGYCWIIWRNDTAWLTRFAFAAD